MRLQRILDSISQSKNPVGSTAQKAGDFYTSGMDTVTIANVAISIENYAVFK